MRYIADLHIHSRFARACSKNLTLTSIVYWCKVKGLNIVACGDFTHPKWFSEISKGLEEVESGCYRVKANILQEYGFHFKKDKKEKRKELDAKIFLPHTDFFIEELQEIRFVMGTEVACIFSHGGKVRRLHLLLFAPNLEIAKKINQNLERAGAKLGSDGRPILGMSGRRVLEMILEIDQRCVMIPAHAWTPWFAVFGSKSGFDSLEECFSDLTPYIFAIETGLSSDPSMNWQVSQLDHITLISNSDAHSSQNLAREANVFELAELSYDALMNAIKKKDTSQFLYTIEFYPEEGKYHYDGHALCGISFSPLETKRKKSLCPVCKKTLTIGVANRVSELADRNKIEKKHEKEFLKNGHIPYKSVVGLDDVIAESVGSVGRKTRVVMRLYEDLIKKFGNELQLLLDTSFLEIQKKSLPEIAEGIRRNRNGEVYIEPGYDGIFGKVKLFSDKERKSFEQTKMF